MRARECGRSWSEFGVTGDGTGTALARGITDAVGTKHQGRVMRMNTYKQRYGHTTHQYILLVLVRSPRYCSFSIFNLSSPISLLSPHVAATASQVSQPPSATGITNTADKLLDRHIPGRRTSVAQPNLADRLDVTSLWFSAWAAVIRGPRARWWSGAMRYRMQERAGACRRRRGWIVVVGGSVANKDRQEEERCYTGLQSYILYRSVCLLSLESSKPIPYIANFRGSCTPSARLTSFDSFISESFLSTNLPTPPGPVLFNISRT